MEYGISEKSMMAVEVLKELMLTNSRDILFFIVIRDSPLK